LVQFSVMGKRILFSALLIPAVACAVFIGYLHAALLFVFLLVLSVYAAREVYYLSARVFCLPRGRVALIWFALPPALLLCAFYSNVFFSLPLRVIIFCAMGIAAGICICIFFDNRRKKIIRILILLSNLLYTGGFPGLLLLLRQQTNGGAAVAFLLLLVWCNDAGAYFTGSFFGRTRRIIKSSPNKSAEGYAGAFFITLLVAFLFRLLIGEKSGIGYSAVAVLAFAMSVTAPAGDILESMLKRRAGVKDSSAFLPGLGGVLDIFDSVLLSVPVYYVLFNLFTA